MLLDAFKSIEKNDVKAFAELLDGGLSVNTVISAASRVSLLMAAVIHKAYDCLDVLLTRQPDLETEAGGKCRALHIAAIHNDGIAARKLIAAGADIHAPSEKGRTPFHLAIENDSVDVMDAILEADRDGAVTPLAMYLAVEKHPRALARLLLEKPDFYSIIGDLDLLQRAVTAGDEDCIVQLLDAGIDPYFMTSETMESVDIFAVIDEKLPHLMPIFSKRARDFDLIEACAIPSYSKFEELMADPDIRVSAVSAEKLTALGAAVQNGSEPMVVALLARGAPVDQRCGEDQFLPIISAMKLGKPEIFRHLIGAGARVLDGMGNSIVRDGFAFGSDDMRDIVDQQIVFEKSQVMVLKKNVVLQKRIRFGSGGAYKP